MRHFHRLALATGMAMTSPLVAQADAPFRTGEGFGHMGGYGYDGFGMFLGPVFMLLLLAALVVGIVVMVRWMAPGAGLGGNTGSAQGDRSLETLNMRLAQGEIDAAEYAERKKLLIGKA